MSFNYWSFCLVDTLSIWWHCEQNRLCLAKFSCYVWNTNYWHQVKMLKAFFSSLIWIVYVGVMLENAFQIGHFFNFSPTQMTEDWLSCIHCSNVMLSLLHIFLIFTRRQIDHCCRWALTFERISDKYIFTCVFPLSWPHV